MREVLSPLSHRVDVLAFVDSLSSLDTRKATSTLRTHTQILSQLRVARTSLLQRQISPTKAFLRWRYMKVTAICVFNEKTIFCTDVFFCRTRMHWVFGSVQLLVILAFSAFDFPNLLAVFLFLFRFPCISTVLLRSVGCNAPPCTESGNSGVHYEYLVGDLWGLLCEAR